jgi:NAD+ kinase
VTLEEDTARKTGIDGYPRSTSASSAAVRHRRRRRRRRHDARHRAPAGPPRHVPLVGINQGRLGFITDIRSATSRPRSRRCCRRVRRGSRTLLEGAVARRQDDLRGVAMNDVVVSRGATAGMVELRVEIDGQFVANQRADGLIVGHADRLDRLCAVGRRADPASRQSPAGCWCRSRRTTCRTGRSCCPTRRDRDRDRVRPRRQRELRHAVAGQPAARRPHPVRRSAAPVRFLHPRGWSYYATLRGKLHWNEGTDQSDAAPPRAPRFRHRRASSSSSSRRLHVLTGETGAGKSILVDALQLRSAAAATPAWCAKARRAPRSAPSSTCPPALAPWLEEAGFDAEAGDACCCAAAIDSQGKSRAWINGSPPRSRSCASWPTTWSTSTASTPGKA